LLVLSKGERFFEGYMKTGIVRGLTVGILVLQLAACDQLFGPKNYNHRVKGGLAQKPVSAG
jgi:hypothetical protein